jgi:N-acetyl sugar amidotransferase
MSQPVICTRCVLDTTIREITFDNQGVCNYCRLHEQLEHQYPLGEVGRRRLAELIDGIKQDGCGKKYDCVVGVSGGVDSSYLLHRAVREGLRPLAVHLDNGWDSAIAVDNIQAVTRHLQVDLETRVLDWEEFRKLQTAFLRASVPDLEIPTDHAIIAALYEAAARHQVRYILNGICFRTEGNMPTSWGYGDARYVSGIYRRFNKERLHHYPLLTLPRLAWLLAARRVRMVRFLNYIDYHRAAAREILARECGWQDYGGHHHESVYTRFYYTYLSPHKFGMDRRKVALAAQVRSGHVTRTAALEHLSAPPLAAGQIAEDRRYVLSKLGLTEAGFAAIEALPVRTFHDYPSYYPLFRSARSLLKPAARLRLVPLIYHDAKFPLLIVMLSALAQHLSLSSIL